MYFSVALEYQKQSFYLIAFVQSLLLLKHCPDIHYTRFIVLAYMYYSVLLVIPRID